VIQQAVLTCSATDALAKPHIRAKVNARIDDDGMIRVVIEWVDVENERVVGEPKLHEEFRFSPERGAAGACYVSRAAWTQGEERGGTFWLDEHGKRHFILRAEAGEFDMTGEKA